MKSIVFYFKNLSEGKLLLIGLAPILTLVLKMQTTLFALAIIILIDMFTGIRKDLFLKNIPFNPFKESFWSGVNSTGLRSTWRKTYEYVAGILAFMVLDSLVLGTHTVDLLGKNLSLSELAVTIACLVEIYSIFENMEAVSGRNLFKTLINLLPEKVKAILSKKK